MTTTAESTKGVPRIEGDPSPTLRADFNALADWALAHVDAVAASTSARNAITKKWVGMRVWVTAYNILYVCTSVSTSDGTWAVAAAVASVATGPASQTDYSAETAVATVTMTLESGRTYKVTGSIGGQQITSTGTVRSRLRLTSASGTDLPANNRLINEVSSTASTTVQGSALTYYTAPSTASVTFVLMAYSSAGAFRVAAGGAFLLVEPVL